jgi:hypothetical protein
MPAFLAWLGSAAFIELLKSSAKWIWGYAWSFLKSLWDNKWILVVASTCTTFFLLIMNMLNSWFGFPALFNIGVHGIFHLSNFVWVVGYWKSSPTPSGGNNSSGPKVQVS